MDHYLAIMVKLKLHIKCIKNYSHTYLLRRNGLGMRARRPSLGHKCISLQCLHTCQLFVSWEKSIFSKRRLF